MGSHPINLLVRFLLELVALIVIGLWGWEQSEEWHRFVWASALPLIAALVWGTFAVPNDPSRSGNAPIKVAGIVRLIIELAFFTVALCAFHDLGHLKTAYVIGSVVIIHYSLSYDRIKWLLSR